MIAEGLSLPGSQFGPEAWVRRNRMRNRIQVAVQKARLLHWALIASLCMPSRRGSFL
jgi:hypothetical protein